MKKILYIAFIMVLFSSCSDFLEPKSQDKIVPNTVEQLKEFLLGEVIAREWNDGEDDLRFLPMMTDDVLYYKIPQQRRDLGEAYFGYYSWQREPEIGVNNNMIKDLNWEHFYHDVFTCNIIIDQIPDMEGTDDEKNELFAETYFMRANSYFMLVNLYGEPYDESTASTALGVPINDNPAIENKLFKRNSVKEVYNKIEVDLLKSVEHFKNVTLGENISFPRINAAYLLLSRMYLFEKDYTNAKKYADLVIENMQGNLADLNSFNNTYFINSENSEVIFSYGLLADYIYRKTSSMAMYVITDEFKNLFDSEDLRYKQYYPRDDLKKYFKSKCGCYGKAFRLTEAYLNRAEAEAYLDELSLAKDDVNELRRNRYKEGSDYELVDTDKDSLIQTIRNERRKEFGYEYYRWFDLRRYGMPKITHLYGFPGEEVTYVLEQGSASYTLPIPEEVIKLNPTITQINRINNEPVSSDN